MSDNKLSLAASAIYRRLIAEPDPMGDPSGDCGDMIAARQREGDLRAIREAGFVSPGQYNSELRKRLTGADLISFLEIRDVCPECGEALNTTSHYTRQYGGGYNKVMTCPGCAYADVYV